MHNFYLRCVESDAPALCELLLQLGALERTEDGHLVAADAGTWDVIGRIHAVDTGQRTDDWLVIFGPLCSPTGEPWFHANLITAVDLAAEVPGAERGRWLILDAQGNVRAPNRPHRIMAVQVQPELPSPVPQSVTMRQARLALLAIGKLTAVAVAINSLPSPHKEAAQIEWEYSATVERHRPFVAMLAPALGLSDAALDALFTAAAKL